ncbi:MAG: hypothetical protein KBA81_05385 [Rhabdochlamydiaceae bacterium]|nr:hypothetical protein [Rhabdochlamydiaceae bacterium]
MKISQTNAATAFITGLQEFYGESSVVLALKKISDQNSPDRKVGERLLQSINQMKPVSQQDKKRIEEIVLQVFEATDALRN